jgi:predicted dehydrogenase
MKTRNSTPIGRREFLRRSAATAALLSFPNLVERHIFAAAGQPGANDRLKIGFIGLGGRARWILTKESLPGADVVAVADCDTARCDAAAKQVAGGDKWKKYQQYRQMLEKEKLDAVFVETTTHARVLACIQAMQAGCDVYGEKPLTLTIGEGKYLIQAVKKYKRILQTGSQQRSMPINMHASKLVRQGAIGKVHTVITHNFLGGKAWTFKPEEPVPASLDWDAWCNQTELRPYHSELQNGWADFNDYDGGGQMWGVTGWGTHSLDQVQCALGTDDTGPVEIWPEGSGPQCRVTMRYENGTLLKLEGKKRGMEDLGAIFIGDQGKIEIFRGDYWADPKELRDNAPPVTPQGDQESVPHIANFFQSVRTRQKPNADVETGHRATNLCHLTNICRAVQRRLKWDPKNDRFLGDEEANKLINRPRRKGYELPEII